MELGGKDPAYVLPDANIDYAVENIIDGAFFNSGQCCCSIERCYVHADVYDEFVKKAIALTEVIITKKKPNDKKYYLINSIFIYFYFYGHNRNIFLVIQTIQIQLLVQWLIFVSLKMLGRN